MAGTDRTREQPEGGPAIVLVEPQLGENIGTAARAMANFGLDDLRLVAPRDGWPSMSAVRAASGADRVVDGARVFATTEEAIADLQFVLATTARTRDMAKPVMSVAEAARELRAREAAGERTGVLFGREKAGLKNDDVVLAHAIVMAPVSPAFASLNLAQAVLLVGYEWYKPVATTFGDPAFGPAPVTRTGPRIPGTRTATSEEVLNFFRRLEQALDEAGFLYPPEKRPAMVRSIRNIFQRANLTEQDVRTLHGIVSALIATGGACRRGEGGDR